MDLSLFTEGLEAKSKEAIKVNEGDYLEDGLLMCGKCHTRKQIEVEILGKVHRPFVLCECESEAQEKRKAEVAQREFDERVRYNRRVAFPKTEMASWTFANDDLSNAKVTEIGKKYVENFPKFKEEGKGLLLYGTVGTGKTYLACEIANALIDKGYSVFVTDLSRLANTLQGMHEGRQEYIDNLNRYSLLIIDDLGIERKSEYMQEIVYNVINARVGRPMIITTNLSLEELKQTDTNNMERWRIYDRIIGKCFPIEVKGGSRRRKEVRETYNEMKNLLGIGE